MSAYDAKQIHIVMGRRMSNTGKIAVALLGAGACVGATTLLESPDNRRVILEYLERAGARQSLQEVAEKIVAVLVKSAFGDRPPTIDAG